MSERRFVLLAFTHMSPEGCVRLYEAGHLQPAARYHPCRHQVLPIGQHVLPRLLYETIQQR